jgi:hypothetical protein
MDKNKVFEKYHSRISQYNLLIEDIRNVLETVPAGTLNGRAMTQLVEWLSWESNGLWARMELVQRINKAGGFPISEYDFLLEVEHPMGAAMRDFRRLLAHIEQQKTLHQMYSII